MAPLQKFVYCLGNVVCLGLAVYKCQVMGLLPTTASDWLAFEEPQRVSVNVKKKWVVMFVLEYISTAIKINQNVVVFFFCCFFCTQHFF